MFLLITMNTKRILQANGVQLMVIRSVSKQTQNDQWPLTMIV